MAAIVGGALAAEWGDEGKDPGEPSATEPTGPTTTTLGPLKEAPEKSVCRIISHAEAEALVGHELENDVVQLPLDGAQCSWPDEKGRVIGQLYLVVKEREPVSLGKVVRHDWTPNENFTYQPVEGLGDEAVMVIQKDPLLAVGLDVHFRDVHVILGNGGRDVWTGTDEEQQQRLRATMATVLDRFAQRLQALDE